MVTDKSDDKLINWSLCNRPLKLCIEETLGNASKKVDILVYLRLKVKSVLIFDKNFHFYFQFSFSVPFQCTVVAIVKFDIIA